MSLNRLLETHKTALEERFKGAGSIDVHGGALRESEISGLLARTPALLLAPVRLDAVRPKGRGATEVDAHLSLAVFTSGTKASDQSTAANTLICDLVTYLDGLGCESIAPRNRFAGLSAGAALAFWEITWKETLRIVHEEVDRDLGILREVWVGQAPNIGAAHAEDYRLVAALDPDDAPSEGAGEDAEAGDAAG